MHAGWIVRSLNGLMAAALLCAALPVWAQAESLLPEGQTLLSLTVTERTRVKEDVLTASLRFEDEDRDAAALQQRINAKMEEALETLDDETDITVSTGQYAVYQYERQPQGGRRDVVWRGSQTVQLESRDAHQRVQELAGELQAADFVINQLSYHLSNERRDEVSGELLEAAVARARERAERAGRALGRPAVEIAELNIDGEGGSGPMMMRAMSAESADAAAPSARAGETEVSLTIRIRAVAQ